MSNAVEKIEGFKKVLSTIAKTYKRHQKITDALVMEYENYKNHKTPLEYLILILNRKLKPDEGLVMNTLVFSHIFSEVPNKSNIHAIHDVLTRFGIFMVPIWQEKANTALFLVFHKDKGKAVYYASEINKALSDQPPDEEYLLTVARIKVTNELEKLEEATPAAIVDALDQLEGDEAFYLGEHVVLYLQIDPRKVISLAEKKGFKVLVLQRENYDKSEENEDYIFFDRLIGLVLSRTEEGLEMGKRNSRYLISLEKEMLEDSESDVDDSHYHKHQQLH